MKIKRIFMVIALNLIFLTNSMFGMDYLRNLYNRWFGPKVTMPVQQQPQEMVLGVTQSDFGPGMVSQGAQPDSQKRQYIRTAVGLIPRIGDKPLQLPKMNKYNFTKITGINERLLGAGEVGPKRLENAFDNIETLLKKDPQSSVLKSFRERIVDEALQALLNERKQGITKETLDSLNTHIQIGGWRRSELTSDHRFWTVVFERLAALLKSDDAVNSWIERTTTLKVYWTDYSNKMEKYKSLAFSGEDKTPQGRIKIIEDKMKELDKDSEDYRICKSLLVWLRKQVVPSKDVVPSKIEQQRVLVMPVEQKQYFFKPVSGYGEDYFNTMPELKSERHYDFAKAFNNVNEALSQDRQSQQLQNFKDKIVDRYVELLFAMGMNNKDAIKNYVYNHLKHSKYNAFKDYVATKIDEYVPQPKPVVKKEYTFKDVAGAEEEAMNAYKTLTKNNHNIFGVAFNRVNKFLLEDPESEQLQSFRDKIVNKYMELLNLNKDKDNFIKNNFYKRPVIKPFETYIENKIKENARRGQEQLL